MTYDVAAVRSHFPALREGAAHFDGPGGSQTPDHGGEGGPRHAGVGRCQPGHGDPGRAAGGTDRHRLPRRSRRPAGQRPRGIVFGRSATALTYDLSRALAKTWRPGDEVVVTRLDHDSNIRPWVQAAAAVGATVRWADFDPATGELSVDAIAAQLSD